MLVLGLLLGVLSFPLWLSMSLAVGYVLGSWVLFMVMVTSVVLWMRCTCAACVWELMCGGMSACGVFAVIVTCFVCWFEVVVCVLCF